MHELTRCGGGVVADKMIACGYTQSILCQEKYGHQGMLFKVASSIQSHYIAFLTFEDEILFKGNVL